MPELLGKWWSENCEIHGYHWPRLHGTVNHHIQPLAWGGPDTEDNQIEICPTGHMNVHVLLDLFADNRSTYGLKERTKGFTRKEIDLAEQGYNAWADAGHPRRNAGSTTET